MEAYKKEVIVDVPHRISGFFEIVDELDGNKITDPVEIGSRGAGFNLSAVGKTKIWIEDLGGEEDNEIEIFINNKKVDKKAETTYYLYNDFKTQIKQPVKISIFHNFDLPVGCGYGASGSGALGAIYGLNHAFNLQLSRSELGKRAHIAEVINRTGLGTVCGQLRGGLCILREPGYPCVSERIPFPNNLRVICGSFGMIHTKSILTDPVLNRKIKEAGRKAQITLLNNRNVKSFMEASLQFVEDTEILNILNLQELEILIQKLNRLKIIGASMNQLGNSVYAICKKEDEGEINEIFESYKPKIKIFNSSINLNGPRILN
jgi:pantoate kinase